MTAKGRMLSCGHLVSTGLHFIQMTLAYFLMLIVMTYNTWLCLAVVFGASLGYFLVGWKKTSVIDVSDHCHWLRTFLGLKTENGNNGSETFCMLIFNLKCINPLRKLKSCKWSLTSIIAHRRAKRCKSNIFKILRYARNLR